MSNFKQKLLAFWSDEEGLTTVEYAVAGGLIALSVIAAFQLLGGEVNRVITEIKDELATTGTGAAA